MRKIYFFPFIIICVFSIHSLFAANKDGRIMMYARLTASQEVPAVNSKAKGLVTFTLEEDYKTLTIYGVFDSLSGSVSNCHLHTGGFGVNGGVVLNLMPLVKGNQINGQVVVTKAILAAINGYGIYINVHTAANPNGEMRGQINYETDLHFVSVMTGGGEVPAVALDAPRRPTFVGGRRLSLLGRTDRPAAGPTSRGQGGHPRRRAPSQCPSRTRMCDRPDAWIAGAEGRIMLRIVAL